ncbi:MAG: holo-ACP synthase [Gemmatimonadota bacterium]|nr:MAG: holo-ACP synthase [Gemmatimonadota bacterium]
MTLVGVGLDLVDVARVEQLLDRYGDRALRRLLTPREQDYCLSLAVPARHVAARIAAKEAAYKALVQGGARRVVWWLDTEVVRDPGGLPSLSFHDRARQSADELKVSRSLLSLTHSDAAAGAVVLLFR